MQTKHSNKAYGRTLEFIDTNHTPGPWTTEPGRVRIEGKIRSADGRCVAQMVRAEDQSLIAAAPDLLAALKGAMHVLEHTQVTPSAVERYERAVAAIAKATGQTS